MDKTTNVDAFTEILADEIGDISVDAELASVLHGQLAELGIEEDLTRAVSAVFQAHGAHMGQVLRVMINVLYTVSLELDHLTPRAICMCLSACLGSSVGRKNLKTGEVETFDTREVDA